jgi:hypothetical protein
VNPEGNRHREKRERDAAIQGRRHRPTLPWIVRVDWLFFGGIASAVRMAGRGEIDSGWNTSSQAISIRRPAFFGLERER